MQRLLTSLVLALTTIAAAAQTSQPPSPPAAPKSQAPRPAGSPTVTVLVTDSSGTPLVGVAVQATGPATREGVTNATGTVRFATVRPGAYRLRFEHEGFITLERDIAVRAGVPVRTEVTLSAAPPAPKAEPPPPPPAPEPATATGPSGEPKTVVITDFLDKNFIGRAPKKESILGCSGAETATLLQFRDPIAEHAHAGADEMLYIVAGEAAIKIAGREQPLTSTALSVIPRGVPHTLTRTGKNPVIALSILSGEACRQQASKN